MKPKIYLLVLILFAMILFACSMFNPFGNDPLDGTSWELVGISDHLPVAGSHISMMFERGQVSGSSGCNRYGGGYKVNGDKIAFDAMYMTEMACADTNMMDQEYEYMKRLGISERFEIRDGQLLIYGSDQDVLTFVPGPTP